MEFEKLIEKTIAELNYICYAEFNANSSLLDSAARKILGAAFTEVRREAIEEAICDAEAGAANLLERLRDLLPPAAEEKGDV